MNLSLRFFCVFFYTFTLNIDNNYKHDKNKLLDNITSFKTNNFVSRGHVFYFVSDHRTLHAKLHVHAVIP